MDSPLRDVCTKVYGHRGLIIAVIGSAYMLCFVIFFGIMTAGTVQAYKQSVGTALATNIQSLNTLVLICLVGFGGLMLSFRSSSIFRMTNSITGGFYSDVVKCVVLIILAAFLAAYAVELNYVPPSWIFIAEQLGAGLGGIYLVLRILELIIGVSCNKKTLRKKTSSTSS